jgi:hypothetical protein
MVPAHSARRLWFMAGQLAVCLAAGEGAAGREARAEVDGAGGVAHPPPPSGRSAGEAGKLSLEQQKQLLNSIYAAFWGFKIIAAGIVICVLGLHGACCLFPNYKTSDAVRRRAIVSIRRRARVRDACTAGPWSA